MPTFVYKNLNLKIDRLLRIGLDSLKGVFYRVALLLTRVLVVERNHAEATDQEHIKLG